MRKYSFLFETLNNQMSGGQSKAVNNDKTIFFYANNRTRSIGQSFGRQIAAARAKGDFMGVKRLQTQAKATGGVATGRNVPAAGSVPTLAQTPQAKASRAKANLSQRIANRNPALPTTAPAAPAVKPKPAPAAPPPPPPPKPPKTTATPPPPPPPKPPKPTADPRMNTKPTPAVKPNKNFGTNLKDKFMNGGYGNASMMGAAVGGIGNVLFGDKKKGIFRRFLGGMTMGSLGGVAAKAATGGNSKYKAGSVT